jgi:hypothetical protein
MRLPRMTTRRWMIAVAVMATADWAWEISCRAYEYKLRAAAMQEREMVFRYVLGLEAGVAEFKGCDATVPQEFDPTTAILPADAERLRRQFFHFRRMRQKYEAAARRPWLPIEPDPPVPRWTPSGASGG